MDDKKVQIQRLMDTLLKVKDQKELRARINDKLLSHEVPMNKTGHEQDVYDQLFPNKRVITPIGNVKMGDNQYKKLIAHDLHDYIGGIHQTLTDPVIITKQDDDRGKAYIFAKSFKHKPKKKDGMISVVTDIDGEKVSISTHPKFMRKVTENIKNAAELTYEKSDNGGTAENGTKALANTNTNDTQLLNNITQSPPVVNRKIDRLNTLLQGEKQRKRGLYERSF